MIPAIRIQDHEGVPVASLEGEVDIANASDVRDQLLALLSHRPLGLIVDLSGVTFFDSRGVHVMLELAERMHARNQQLRLVVPDTNMIKRVLQLTHLDSIVPLDASVEDAAAQMELQR